MTTESSAKITHAIETPRSAPGALGVIRVTSDALDDSAHLLEVRIPKRNAMSLVELGGIDQALLARVDERSLLVMPHGGVAIMRQLSQWLSDRGVPEARRDDPMVVYPEARDIHEARMLAALARCTSPRGIDLLLDQPRRWRDGDDSDPERDRVLDRLLDPPTIVMIGRANIGKSSLVNALAQDRVALVADHEGTTRDHVGVELVLDGLSAFWVDAPGLLDDQEDQREFELLDPVLQRADLILIGMDLGREREEMTIPTPERVRTLRVGLRADLSDRATERVDVRCSAKTRKGLDELASIVREALVPDAAIEHQGAWRFWDEN